MPLNFVNLRDPAPAEITAQEFLRECLLLTESCAYRGQGNADWDIVPAAFRNSQNGKCVKRPDRDVRLQYFFSDAFGEDYRRISLIEGAREGLEFGNESDGFALLKKMVFFQHFGIPTPLLDWTDSPLIALFMAYIFRPASSSKMRIFRLHRDKLPERVMIFQRYDTLGFERIRRQMGGILCSGTISSNKRQISITSTTIGDYYDDEPTTDFVDRIDVLLDDKSQAAIDIALARNGFTLDSMFPASSYWLGKAIALGLPWKT